MPRLDGDGERVPGFPPHLHPVHYEPRSGTPRSSTRRTPGRSALGGRLPRRDGGRGGIGWGALTIKLLEAVGPAGKVISYECGRISRRAGRARFGGISRMPETTRSRSTTSTRDRRAGRGPRRPGPPEPWHVVPTRRRPSSRRIILSYLPFPTDPGEAALANGSPRPAASPSRRPSGDPPPWHVKGMSVGRAAGCSSHSAFLVVAAQDLLTGGIIPFPGTIRTFSAGRPGTPPSDLIRRRPAPA